MTEDEREVLAQLLCEVSTGVLNLFPFLILLDHSWDLIERIEKGIEEGEGE